jgi:hypothetical protein
MAVLLGAMIRNERAGRAIIHALGSFAAKQSILVAVCPVYIKDKKLLAIALKTLARAKKLVGKRNELTSHLWTLKLGTKVQPWLIVRKPVNETKKYMIPKPINDIDALFNAIDLLIDRLSHVRRIFQAEALQLHSAVNCLCGTFFIRTRTAFEKLRTSTRTSRDHLFRDFDYPLALGALGRWPVPHPVTGFPPFRQVYNCPFSYADREVIIPACTRVGIRVRPVAVARNSLPYQVQPACQAFGVCHVCPIEAIYNAGVHVRRAEETGNVRVVPNATVLRFNLDTERRITSVSYAWLGRVVRSSRLESSSWPPTRLSPLVSSCSRNPSAGQTVWPAEMIAWAAISWSM